MVTPQILGQGDTMKLKLSSMVVLGMIVAVVSSFLTASVCCQKAYERVKPRAVLIEGETGSCSGVILQTGIVLTCAHCTGGKLKINGNEATIIRKDDQADLAILAVETGKWDSLVIRDTSASEDIFSWGFPMQSPNPVFTKGYVRVIQLGKVFGSTYAIPGSSGSPVFNSKGYLVALNQGYMPGPMMSVNIPAVTIRQFLEVKDVARE